MLRVEDIRWLAVEESDFATTQLRLSMMVVSWRHRPLGGIRAADDLRTYLLARAFERPGSSLIRDLALQSSFRKDAWMFGVRLA